MAFLCRLRRQGERGELKFFKQRRLVDLVVVMLVLYVPFDDVFVNADGGNEIPSGPK